MIGYFRFNQIMYVLISFFLMGVSINILLFKEFGVPMAMSIEPTYLKLWMCLALSLLSMWCSAYWKRRAENQYVGRIVFKHGNNVETLSHVLTAIDKRIFYLDRISFKKLQFHPIYRYGLKITANGGNLYVDYLNTPKHVQYFSQIMAYFLALEGNRIGLETFAKRNFTEKND